MLLGLKSCSTRKVPLLKKALYRPIWSFPMIQRRTGWRCCGQMRPKSSSLSSSTQLAVFGGGMLPMTPRTPSPLSNMEVETLCFGGVFSAKGTGQLHRIKGTSGPGYWSQPGHWKWVVDWYSSMTMTQNTWPMQWLKKTLRSWSGLASLQTLIPYKICGGSWRFELPSVSIKTLMTWRRSAKRSETKSLQRENPCWQITEVRHFLWLATCHVMFCEGVKYLFNANQYITFLNVFFWKKNCSVSHCSNKPTIKIIDR